MKRTLIIFAFAAIVAGCNSNANENAKINQDSIRIANEKAKLDSFERAEAAEKAAIIAVANDRAARAQSSQNVSSRRTGTSSRSNYSSGTSNQTYTPAAAPQKKGWSSAAKGAVIGGVVGAGTGVIVDKKDGRGAVIGGVVGAGTGYVIGRSRDKRTGRAQ
ncbi:MAG: YMGG-like glycine zipper-containing protein [Daejeonella sp.]